MKRVKVAIAALGMLCIVPFFMKQIYSNNELQAAGTSFSLYEKVYIANNLYTVIGNDGSNVKLLMDGTTGTAQTWSNANSTAINFASITNVGVLGNEILKNKYSLPLSTNLTAITTSNKLNAQVPTVGGDWWLGDGTSNNRNKFMTSDNRNNGTTTITAAKQDQTTGECSSTTSTLTGEKLATTKTDDDLSVQVKTGRDAITVKGKADVGGDILIYTTSDCSGVAMTLAKQRVPAAETQLTLYRKGDTYFMNDSDVGMTDDKRGLFYMYTIMKSFGVDLSKAGDKHSGEAHEGFCSVYNEPVIIDINNFEVNSWKISKKDSNAAMNFTVEVVSNVEETEKKVCAGATNNAGTALARPMATLPTSSILFANTAKRNYASGSILSDSFPSSSAGTNKPYLTLLNPNLGISLTSGASGVKGSTYSVEMPTDYIVKLPVTLSGNTEKNRYVSASANIGGSLQYGVLKQVNSNSDTVEIDLRQFTEGDPSALSQISLTLYHENEGSYKTAYMGNGTAITVNLLSPQEISFATDNPTNAEYGSLTTIKAQLDTLTAKQSGKDIKFSIVSGNATIDSQSYNSSTGIATASIKPTSGTGNVVIAIDKEGDTTASAATRQTMTLTLDKKDITVIPTRFTKTYLLNETMPALSSTCADLVNGDTLPSVLIPVLEPLDDSASSPSTDGVITNIGSWKQVYSATVLDALPTAFTDKYNITLQDWDDDSTYILQTSLDAIPEGWLIVSPDGNDAGWNHENVTISLSQEAKNMGYDRIEEVKQTGEEITVVQSGETLVYSSETSSKIPHIRITNKAQTQTSEAMDIRELKIDKTDPTISNVTVEKKDEWVIGQKKISVSASDALSGIKEITAACGDKTYTATLQNSVYSFNADQNGTYTITVSDIAGNTATITQEVSKITASSISLTADPENLTSDQPKQKITLTWDAGPSDVKNFNVYYEQDGAFVLLEALNQETSPYDWYAEMNGTFRFELTNNAGEVKQKDVVITMVNPPVPVTQITAYEKDTPANAYTSGIWINKDIELKVENANDEVTDTVTWEYKKENETEWKSLDGTTLSVSTSTNTYLNTIYQFKAKVDKGGTGDVSELSAKNFTVKIDKTDANLPIIQDAESYTEDDWYAKTQTITTSVEAKESGATQTVYVCEGAETECKNDPTKWTSTTAGSVSVSDNGSHELYFKSMDEAGNESAMTSPIYVNINNEEPEITIKIKNNPIKELINELTFGFFYQKTVDITIEADFSSSNAGIGGDIYYILDTDGGPAPSEDDARWLPYQAFSLTPETKAMIYVKAVSDAGQVGTDSSQFTIHVDTIPPTISATPSTDWVKDNTLEVSIEDENSGVDTKTITYAIDEGSAVLGTLVNGKLNLTGLKDGEYDIVVKASDHSGNEATKTYPVLIDTTKPVISQPSTDTSGWAQEKIITFIPRDNLSGLDEVKVKQSDGSSVDVTKNADGSYSFTVTENDTYTITASDKAGNTETSTYTETTIDITAPTIENIVIANETDWKTSKQVTFDVVDSDSDIDEVSVTLDGDLVRVNEPITGNGYSFTAQEAGTYTISAKDKAGNTTTKTVTVDKISTDGIRIKNISDTSTWVKDQMTVSFDVEPGDSGLKENSVQVTYEGTVISVTLENGHYSFTATENGTYEITAENNAGDSASEQLTITKIDSLAPIITDVSDNTTSSEWREPQDITFHVKDYNDALKTSIGSGIKNGYPKLYYEKDGDRVEVPLVQDGNDPTKFTFHADQNTTYTIEAIDVVEHTMVTYELLVDHIYDEADLSPIVVKAWNDTTQIASGTWVSGSIRFEITGGLDDSLLEKYQVAITDGSDPVEADWKDLNYSDHEHEVTGNVNGDVYWFRAVPSISNAISTGFIVHLDNESPNDIQVNMKAIHTNPIARFLNTLSFGTWMKEAQEVTFSANDNFTPQDELTYMYYEEKDGVKGNWTTYHDTLTYNDTDITLYVKAIDLAGNESGEFPQPLAIDSVPPQINGVQDKKKYKYYYLPRYVTVTDEGSGVKESSYQKDDGEVVSFNREVSLKDVGTYFIQASDQADNETELTFKIVPLPFMDEIDGSEDSKAIIDQVKKELEEIKSNIDANETANFDKWIKDAQKKWEDSRKSVIETEDKTAKVEGDGSTTFDPTIKLYVKKVATEKIPELPRKALYVYDVYMMKGETLIQPDGTVKVYLPYHEDAEPIVYEIDEDGTVKIIEAVREGEYVTFITKELKRYAISNVDQKEQSKTCPSDINYDSDQDGKPDVNIDLDGDCVADLNIDIDDDHIPDINIDTKGEGKPTYNVDTNNDQKADVNIGPIPKPWKPDFCSTVKDVEYCTMKELEPEINIDTDGDGKPDINVDVDGDGKPDINIDVDGDGKADVNIDTDGDQIADSKIDKNGNGIPDDEEQVENQTGEPATTVKGTFHQGTTTPSGMGGASTGDSTSFALLFSMFSMSTLLLIWSRKGLKR